MTWKSKEEVQLSIDAIKLMAEQHEELPQYVVDIFHSKIESSEEAMVLEFYKSLEEDLADMLRFFAPQGEQEASSS
ncbi:hypothetical protein F9B85_08415 [Heliorestis acidaminivorans]|uniref:Uncharacterized protein n=1 Tax=Heliorestis acidaminivorans TaxID=553427 RepID=A0A6I0ER06_9FIRM|nr:hypothetical protein [Heliorestis acidaminivorans]KAB2952666.1 hypothetical protein F9B85_08415 [Heliorestis acidaminivorans]